VICDVIWRCWLGDRKGIRRTACKKAGRWFVGGDSLSGALHVLYLQLSQPPPSSLAPVKSRVETFCYRFTLVVVENGRETSVESCAYVQIRVYVRLAVGKISSKQLNRLELNFSAVQGTDLQITFAVTFNRKLDQWQRIGRNEDSNRCTQIDCIFKLVSCLNFYFSLEVHFYCARGDC